MEEKCAGPVGRMIYRTFILNMLGYIRPLPAFMKTMAKLIKKPPANIEKFYGNPLHFRRFIRQFNKIKKPIVKAIARN